MAWFIHHLDLVEYCCFQYVNTYKLRAGSLYNKAFRLSPYSLTRLYSVPAMRTKAFKAIQES